MRFSQGYTLGPLFLLYINDLQWCTQGYHGVLKVNHPPFCRRC